jgi:hypothetical protein
VVLWKIHGTPKHPMWPHALPPEQYQLNSITAMIVSREYSGNYGLLQGAQGTFCSKPRGSSWLSSLRSDGSQDHQAGEASKVEP